MSELSANVSQMKGFGLLPSRGRAGVLLTATVLSSHVLQDMDNGCVARGRLKVGELSQCVAWPGGRGELHVMCCRTGGRVGVLQLKVGLV